MTPGTRLLLTALTRPETVAERSLEELDLLVRVARMASLEARLCHLLRDHGVLDTLPDGPRRHLEAAAMVSDRQQDMARWEVAQIHRALYPRGIPVVVLKGAAYVLAGLPCARGRLFTDVDILVPRGALHDTERALFANGWVNQTQDAYDQSYYRRWMHELPPLTHVMRKSTLDVHHTILPPTARLKPDAGRLLADAVPISGVDDLYVLAPVDMVLHSATHLFHDGELEHGLRDLTDLDDLLRHFGQDPDFWPALVARARQMDLIRPLYYGLRYTQAFLSTPIPGTVVEELSDAGPTTPLRPLMDILFHRGLAPHHWCCDDALSGVARWLLYVRSHYLRMPLHLLIPHLVRKAIRKRLQEDSKRTAPVLPRP
ncbi:hypothetical protein B1C78_16025 [Thioalkalivibrio denitrificans]|uniref:Nucleotidyltransferase n=1 Tax=Thioalkalivibrio denitrificans TaxID=108003 RepID=A0A1V3N9K4_9GAMM|nr:nucleotidyltransferase family protein [Thioalkalivibrio denitrificans]OOG21787.1 hypothetical protein B1C78_16025 [Thioalkalivibrio denitrificans]